MINVSETIKEWRKSYGLTQEGLARAIFCDRMTVTNYETGKRKPDIDTLEQIANVFGYTLDFSVVKKVDSNIDKNFYKKEKTFKEISDISNEDLTQYILVTQSDYIISNICNIDDVLMRILSPLQLRELLLERISCSNRLAIYYKLNKMYLRFADEMADFANHLEWHLSEVIDCDTLKKVKYFRVMTLRDIEDDWYKFEEIYLLDENKEDLGIDMGTINPSDNWDVAPLESELSPSLAEFLEDGYYCDIELYLN